MRYTQLHRSFYQSENNIDMRDIRWANGVSILSIASIDESLFVVRFLTSIRVIFVIIVREQSLVYIVIAKTKSWLSEMMSRSGQKKLTNIIVVIR